MKKGFTLIELLIVLLIIGILAAVALPQYQTAVKKSRLVRYFPVVASLAQAEEIYFMNNNVYSVSADNLDLVWLEGVPANGDSDYGYIRLPDGTRLDLIGGDSISAGSSGAFISIKTPDDLEYRLYLQQSVLPGKRYCSGDERVCKSLGCTSYTSWCYLP